MAAMWSPERRMDIAIKVTDELNVRGGPAWVCEHLGGAGPGCMEPGQVSFCTACKEKFDQGAALVYVDRSGVLDGRVLKPTAKGRWVKAQAAGK